MYKKMLEHFRSESYKIPGVKDGELLEVEKFWLVRVILFYFEHVFCLVFLISNIFGGKCLFSLVTVCYGKDVFACGELLLIIVFENHKGIFVLRNGIRWMRPLRDWRARSSGDVNLASMI